MRKKIIVIFSIVCMLLLLGGVLAACGGGTTQQEPEDGLALNEEALTLDINENFRLLVNGEKYTGKWTSSDNEIASVDNSGLVVGLKAGEAVIGITVGEDSAECHVTVYSSGYAPVLETDQDDVTLGHSGEYVVSPYVTVGGAKANDELSYSWSYAENAQEDVVSFTQQEDGSIVLKGVNNGTTELYVTTTARKTMLAKKVTVTVVDDSVIMIVANLDVGEGGYVAELALAEGHGYTSSIAPEIVIYEGDAQVTQPSLRWETEGKGIVSEENGVLTANSLGTETVKVFFGDEQVSIAVSVIRPVVASYVMEERTEVNLDAIVSGGTLMSSPTTLEPVDLSVLDLDGLEGVASVKDASGNALDASKFTASGSTLNIAVSVFNVSRYGDSQLTVVVEDAYFSYEVTIPVYLITKVIKTVADMDVVFFDGKTNVTGYFVLGNDIDYQSNTSYVKKFTAGDVVGGFMGIFDGRGHTIKNYTQPENKNENQNLFGILRNATISNVNFENVTISSYKASGIFARNAYASTLENITIRDAKFTSITSEGSANGALLFGWWLGTTNTFKDINIYLGQTGSVDGYLHNLFAGGNGDGGGVNTLINSITNVNVYNAKQVQWIIGTALNTATLYNSFAGLKIYSDTEGRSEYQF